MTNQEKQRINDLRTAGLSYQAIADETGISLGSIKMYFKRSKEVIHVPRCEQCNKSLRQDLERANRRFCSDTCRRRWWVAHPETMNHDQDDRPAGYRTYIYLNLWSDVDPTDMANRIRQAMYDADFWMLEESDKGYNQPAYDPATRTYTVQWTWVYWQEAL